LAICGACVLDGLSLQAPFSWASNKYFPRQCARQTCFLCQPSSHWSCSCFGSFDFASQTRTGEERWRALLKFRHVEKDLARRNDMSTAVLTNSLPRRWQLSSIASTTLIVAARSWFVVTVVGQLFFAFAIASFYTLTA